MNQRKNTTTLACVREIPTDTPPETPPRTDPATAYEFELTAEEESARAALNFANRLAATAFVVEAHRKLDEALSLTDDELTAARISNARARLHLSEDRTEEAKLFALASVCAHQTLNDAEALEEATNTLREVLNRETYLKRRAPYWSAMVECHGMTSRAAARFGMGHSAFISFLTKNFPDVLALRRPKLKPRGRNA